MSKFWKSINDKDIALDAILTGYKGEVENMPVYEEVTKRLKHHGSILDFGCGAGRNIKYLQDHYDTVYGYDYDNMLQFVSRETLNSNVILTSDLNKIYLYKYDEILFSLVLQHITPNEIRSILENLSLASRRFIIHSRTWVDFTFEPILPILEEYFNIVEIEYIKDHNSPENDHFIGVFTNKNSYKPLLVG